MGLLLTDEVYGMGIDLSTILAVMGTVFVGDVLSLAPGFSIGGFSPAVSNILGNGLGLLGMPARLFLNLLSDLTVCM